MAAYVEQTAIDGGKHQLGWMLTGLPQPPFNLTSRNQVRNQEEPFGLLTDPKWMAANLSYVKDLDYFETRQKAAANSQGSDAPPAGASGSTPTTSNRRARPKAKAAAAQ